MGLNPSYLLRYCILYHSKLSELPSFVNKKLVGHFFLKGMVLILTRLYAIVTDQTRIVAGSSSCFISNMDQAEENWRRGLKNLQHMQYRQSWPLKHPLKKRKCSKLVNYIVPFFLNFRCSFMTDLKSIEGPYSKVSRARNKIVEPYVSNFSQEMSETHSEYIPMQTFICRKYSQYRYRLKESS